MYLKNRWVGHQVWLYTFSSSFNFSWKVTTTNECSSRCGPGRMNQGIRCMKSHVRRKPEVVVNDHHCQAVAGLERPQEVVECQGPCDQTYWKYTAWTPVSLFILNCLSCIICFFGTGTNTIYFNIYDKNCISLFYWKS